MNAETESLDNGLRSVSPQGLRSEQAKYLLLDVRTPAEFHEAHIEGAVSHPLGNLDPKQVTQLATGKESCILICRSGNRARQAGEKLKANGLSSLAVLEGGILAWEASGLELNRGQKTISLERQVRIAAGSVVFIGAVLATFLNPVWIGLSAFVGAGLVFAGVTDTCAMGMLIARMPWNNRVS